MASRYLRRNLPGSAITRQLEFVRSVLEGDESARSTGTGDLLLQLHDIATVLAVLTSELTHKAAYFESPNHAERLEAETLRLQCDNILRSVSILLAVPTDSISAVNKAGLRIAFVEIKAVALLVWRTLYPDADEAGLRAGRCWLNGE